MQLMISLNSPYPNSTGKDIFFNKKVNKLIPIFNETILIIMTNIFAHDTEVLTYRKPPWINNKVKTTLKEKK